MRVCDGCTLCCKVARIEELNKATNTMCVHCDGGCAIYDKRPKECQEFRCLWLDSSMPEEYRPDRVGFYVTLEGEIAKVCVDIRKPGAWKGKVGYEIISDLRERGHVLVQVANQLTFLKGFRVDAPKKLLLDWTL